MPENNQILSVEGQLIGMPTAGPESFTIQQLAYLKQALGVDETVLYSGTLDGDMNSGWTCTLSELATNFEKIRICYGKTPNVADSNDIGWGTTEFYTADLATFGNLVTFFNCMAAGNKMYTCYTRIAGWNTVNLSSTMGSQATLDSAGKTETSVRMYPFKIVGIHRIAGGN